MIKAFEYLKKNSSAVIAIVITACIYIFFYATASECPIKHLFGISCAGCGMSRALLCALRFDFASAFYYHPLWFAVLPVFSLLLLFHFRKNKKSFYATLIPAIVTLLAVYLARIIFGDDNVVVFTPSQGAIAMVISKIFC